MGGMGGMGGMPPMNPQMMQMMQNPAVQRMYATAAAARCMVSSRVFVLTTCSLRVWQGFTACCEPRNGESAPASHAIRGHGEHDDEPSHDGDVRVCGLLGARCSLRIDDSACCGGRPSTA